MNQAILKPNHFPYVKTFAPVVPYVAVIIGMYLLDSAWGSMLLYHAGMVALLTATGSWQLGQRLHKWQDYVVLALVIMGSALGGVFIFLLWPTMKLAELVLVSYLSSLGLQKTTWLLFMLYYFTINPILEEIFWRGYLGSSSSKPTWNDIWFAGYHTLVLYVFVKPPWIVASFIILLIFAWLWRQMARRYNGLMMPILSHAAADAGIMAAAHLLILQAL